MLRWMLYCSSLDRANFLTCAESKNSAVAHLDRPSSRNIRTDVEPLSPFANASKTEPRSRLSSAAFSETFAASSNRLIKARHRRPAAACANASTIPKNVCAVPLVCLYCSSMSSISSELLGGWSVSSAAISSVCQFAPTLCSAGHVLDGHCSLSSKGSRCTGAQLRSLEWCSLAQSPMTFRANRYSPT